MLNLISKRTRLGCALAGLAAALTQGGCTKISSAFNEFRYECGDVEQPAQGGVRFVYILTRNSEAVPGEQVNVLWHTGDKREARRLAVSGKGCFALPQEAGELIVATHDKLSGKREVHEASTLAAPQQRQVLELKPLLRPDFSLSCGRALLRSLDGLPVQLSWQNMADSDMWQVQSVELLQKKVGEEEAQAEKSVVSLTDARSFQGSGLLMTTALSGAAADGRYELRAQAKTVTGDAFPAKSTCFFELDQTAPAPSRLLGKQLHDKRQVTALKGYRDTAKAFFCIAPRDATGGCSQESDFKAAAPYIDTPGAGWWRFYSYSEDAAGNKSPLQSEDFYVDDHSPVIDLSWDDPLLARTPTLAPSFGYTYRLKIAVSDDASDQKEIKEAAELQERTTCRVQLTSPTGAQILGYDAECSSPGCQGQSLDDWRACGAGLTFKIKNEAKYLDHMVTIEAKVTDSFERSAVAAQQLWINADKLGEWKADPSLAFAKLPADRDFFFIEDHHKRLIALTAVNNVHDGKARPLSFVQLFLKPIHQGEWLGPILLNWQGERNYGNSAIDSAMPVQPLAVSQKLMSSDGKGSLWFYGTAEGLDRRRHSGLFEIKLPEKAAEPGKIEVLSQLYPEEYRFNLPIKFHPFDLTLREQFFDQGEPFRLKTALVLMAYDDTRGLLVISHQPVGGAARIFTFDGVNFSDLGEVAAWHNTPVTQLLRLPQHLLDGENGAGQGAGSLAIGAIAGSRLWRMETTAAALQAKAFDEPVNIGAVYATRDSLLGYRVSDTEDPNRQSYQLFEMGADQEQTSQINKYGNPFVIHKHLQLASPVMPTIEVPFIDRLYRSKAGEIFLSSFSRKINNGEQTLLRRSYLATGSDFYDLDNLWSVTDKVQRFSSIGYAALQYMKIDIESQRIGRVDTIIDDIHGNIYRSTLAGIKKRYASRWVEVSEQGVFRGDRYSNPITDIVSKSDNKGRIYRLMNTKNGSLISSTLQQPDGAVFLKRKNGELVSGYTKESLYIYGVINNIVYARIEGIYNDKDLYLIYDADTGMVEQEYLGPRNDWGYYFTETGRMGFDADAGTIYQLDNEGKQHIIMSGCNPPEAKASRIIRIDEMESWFFNKKDGASSLHVCHHHAGAIKNLTFNLGGLVVNSVTTLADGTILLLARDPGSTESKKYPSWYALKGDKWVNWDHHIYSSEFKWPDWHPSWGGKRVAQDVRLLFFDSVNNDIWLEVGYPDNEMFNYLAHYSSGKWEFFNESNSPFELGGRTAILRDAAGHTYLNTGEGLRPRGIYLYQP
jgi:hypothetical protein